MTNETLVPPNSLLPQSEKAGSAIGRAPSECGALRPFSATLAVTPITCGKHDTQASRWEEKTATQKPGDGRDSPPEPDTVIIPHYDT